jgi:large subunit ribosomal protein L19
MKLIEKIEGEQLKKDKMKFRVGDSVKVHTRVREGEKDRVQIFAGVVIARKGRGMNENVTVRRISYGEGVERVFPVHSPRVEKIEVERAGRVPRAKLYYLRKRTGKEAMGVKDAASKEKVKDPTAA